MFWFRIDAKRSPSAAIGSPDPYVSEKATVLSTRISNNVSKRSKSLITYAALWQINFEESLGFVPSCPWKRRTFVQCSQIFST